MRYFHVQNHFSRSTNLAKTLGRPKKILVAPLGWGLGHATRCVPIVRELQRQGAEVLLASDGSALVLLQQEFPDLISFELPGYNVRYGSRSMVWGIAAQLPKIGWAIWREHWLLRKLVQQHGIDAVVSDNRFGCFAPKKRCVFITHQLNIPVTFWGLKTVVNFFNHLIINRFDECWVPDVAVVPNLSGELSHPVPRRLRQKVKFIGALTRMKAVNLSGRAVASSPIPHSSSLSTYDAIAVLSGPEPQRTALETAILEQASQLPIRLLLVQGKPEQPTPTPDVYPKNIHVMPSMTTEALTQAILESGVFIGRSGYSTVMDLARLGRPALLIPTPGQPEQVYLAEKLAMEGAVVAQQQVELDLESGIAEAKKRTRLSGDLFDGNVVQEAVAILLRSIQC